MISATFIPAPSRFPTLALRALGVAFAGLIAATDAQAQDTDSALAMVRETTEKLVAMVRASVKDGEPDPAVIRREVDRVLKPTLDLEGASRLALGGHWKRATPAQRKLFSTALGKLLLGTYATAIASSADAAIEYLGSEPSKKGSSVRVRTRITPSTSPAILVDYRVRERDGRWRLFDVAIEGVSLMRAYRSSFNAEIRRSGIEGLTRKIEEKAAGSDKA